MGAGSRGKSGREHSLSRDLRDARTGNFPAGRPRACSRRSGSRASFRALVEPWERLDGRLGGPKNLGDSTYVARDDLIQATGSVDKILGGGRYQISLDSGQTVTAQLSGRMRRFRIRVIPGDRVQVGLSPYDPTHGFITFRLREGEQPPGN